MNFTVAADEAGLRLDAFLVRRAVVPSAAAARRLILGGDVRVDGRVGRKGVAVNEGQVVACGGGALAEPGIIIAEPDVALIVLHEDETLVAVAKPAGMATHPLRAGERGTLAGALVARFPECRQASADWREGGFVHRLDAGTSGVIVAARSRAAHQTLRQTLGGGDSEKCYLAEVVGDPGWPSHTVVDIPIGRRGRQGQTVVLGQGRGLLPARTEVAIVHRRPLSALVEARIRAGRTHQVRIHLAHLRHAIVGDVLYGGPDAGALLLPGEVGFRLHSWRLQLQHPRSGATLTIMAPPPPWAARPE